MNNLKYSDETFSFKKCTIKNLEEICKIQEIAFENLDNKELLRRNSREMLEACFYEPHYVLGAFHKEKLVAFAILFDGGKTDENIGKDIGVSEENLSSVINFKLVIVLPEYRGNRLHIKLIYELEKVAIAKGKKLMCATVSPMNVHSSKNFEKAGFIFHSKKMKYSGLERNIYYKELD